MVANSQPLSPERLLREGALFGSETGPKRGPIQKELPWHRHAARYLAMQMSYKDTAKACDCTPETISFLARTPWFQAIVSQEMEKMGQNVLSLFSGSALDAHATLVEVMQNPKAPTASRVACAKEILDRVLGKSVQVIEATTHKGVPLDPIAAVAEKERELQHLRDLGKVMRIEDGQLAPAAG